MSEGLQRPGFAAAMRLERDHLFDSGHFAKAPTLMRLLAFLVEETLAGRGDQLKSYSVAVDGLGREADFDTQTDSYPRVQVVRLRKMLEAFYARHDPAEHSCIFLKTGSYRVRLAPLSAAYPELVRAHSVATVGKFPAPEVEIDVGPAMFEETGFSQPPIPAEDCLDIQSVGLQSSHLRHWRLIAAALLVILIVLFTYAFSLPALKNTSQTAVKQIEAPVLLLEPASAATNARSVVIADDIYALLADGIGRSWIVRLRMPNATMPSSRSSMPAYRITMQLGEGNGDIRPLYLRLTEYESANLLWATTVSIKSGRSVEDSLGQAIAQLTGPFGVIAARENRIAQGDFRPGYSCLLGYLSNIMKNSSKTDDVLVSCLNKENADAKLDAVRLAFQSFQMMEGSTGALDRKVRILSAMNLARQSIDANPKEAYAHFAMARIQFVTGNCQMGRQHAGHAVEANPYDPVILAVLGSFTATCGYKEGFAMLDRAYAYRSPGESYARLSLILAAIWQKRFDRLQILREDGEHAAGASAAYHYVCETLIAAALDDTNAARSNWQKFRASPNSRSGSDDEMLKSLIMSPDIRARILRLLNEKGILSHPKG
jgi:hypothetical protein